jgi:hypothetical protein
MEWNVVSKQHDSVIGHSGLALTLSIEGLVSNIRKGEASEEIHVLLFY